MNVLLKDNICGGLQPVPNVPGGPTVPPQAPLPQLYPWMEVNAVQVNTLGFTALEPVNVGGMWDYNANGKDFYSLVCKNNNVNTVLSNPVGSAVLLNVNQNSLSLERQLQDPTPTPQFNNSLVTAGTLGINYINAGAPPANQALMFAKVELYEVLPPVTVPPTTIAPTTINIHLCVEGTPTVSLKDIALGVPLSQDPNNPTVVSLGWRQAGLTSATVYSLAGWVGATAPLPRTVRVKSAKLLFTQT